MKNGYLFCNEELTIVEGKHARLFLEIRTNGKIRGKYVINESTREILEFYGKRIDKNLIISEMSQKHGIEKVEMESVLMEFISDMEIRCNLKTIISTNYIEDHEVRYRRESTIYPYGAMIEITNSCNLKCIHCYGGFCSSNKKYMNYDDFTSIIDQLEALQVESVELTGGEITIHPDLIKMVDYILNTNIQKIGLITNGTNLSEEIMQRISDNRDRILLQIDLHGFSDEYLNWFMGTKNYAEKNKSVIETAVKNSKYFRVATVITKRNLNQIRDIADWLYGVGVRQYGISLVIPEGRAIECGEKDLFLNDQELLTLKNVLSDIEECYPGFISVIDDNTAYKNCGCISNCVYINVEGNIKMCAMDNGDAIATPIGNVIEEGVSPIFRKKQEYIELLAELESPKCGLEYCKDCKSIAYCAGCILRAIHQAKVIGKECNWYTHLKEKTKQFIFGEDI